MFIQIHEQSRLITRNFPAGNLKPLYNSQFQLFMHNKETWIYFSDWESAEELKERMRKHTENPFPRGAGKGLP
ncbi:hypothetical protein AKMU_09950 [Akkermansia muciniphila]|nr:hypothetical protein AKMU_09950 [Akkermansia muciniphila]GLU93213.1 hypothetical protein Amuc01_16570 [Akkermansia muciniphila]